MLYILRYTIKQQNLRDFHWLYTSFDSLFISCIFQRHAFIFSSVDICLSFSFGCVEFCLAYFPLFFISFSTIRLFSNCHSNCQTHDAFLNKMLFYMFFLARALLLATQDTAVELTKYGQTIPLFTLFRFESFPFKLSKIKIKINTSRKITIHQKKKPPLTKFLKCV